MKYIIMADGRGTRWNNHLGVPKHLVEVNGETLLARTVRQIKTYEPESEIIITSHDERYEIEGSRRYEPQSNLMEIDRFTYELIQDNMCFLYGDTYYTDESIISIVNRHVDDILFFGNQSSIVAIKIKNSQKFKHCVDTVKKLFVTGRIKNCIGWQVYQCFNGYEYDVKKIGANYIVVDNKTVNINKMEDLKKVDN